MATSAKEPPKIEVHAKRYMVLPPMPSRLYGKRCHRLWPSSRVGQLVAHALNDKLTGFKTFSGW
jgi:hypothetical protein